MSTTRSQRPPVATLLAPIPQSSGVYLFYNAEDVLLYVGKSKTLKARVRAHFRDRRERMMMSRVRRIETRDTAGELGALLLESKLIKELKPMFNRAQRQRRRIIVAERRMTAHGYLSVVLRAVDGIDARKSGEILGVFKHTTQAKEFLEKAAKERKLCPVLLGLEQGRSGRLKPCFSYHLGYCSGACIGEEASASYNARVEQAFEDRRIVAWPYKRGLVITEVGAAGREELFLVDNWVLVGSVTRQGASVSSFVPSLHRFDYDTYKLIYTFLDRPGSGLAHRTPPASEWNRLLKLAAN